MLPYQETYCARYGAATLEEILIRKQREGLTAADAIYAMVSEMSAAEDAEEEAALSLALSAACLYCGAAPQTRCRRVRGRWAGQPLRYGRGQVGGLEYHRSRYSAALAADLDKLLA